MKSLTVSPTKKGDSGFTDIKVQPSIRDNLMLMAINELKKTIDEKMSVPLALEQNKFIWVKAMMKLKPLQDCISNFSQEVQRILIREMRLNDKQLEKFMKTTHKPDESISNVRTYLS